ncbi:hypothetical protein F5887DRAFT_923825 [Amanita rubescens]|nr:hypothetical protein F5887DRAFT_923825 [Amanita rubescens]
MPTTTIPTGNTSFGDVCILLPLVLGNSLSNYKHICEAIASAISPESAVFYAGSNSYDSDIRHWAITGSQRSACTVEPGNANDVGKVVKSGGYVMNPGFSSTPGVQIAMTRFNEVIYDSSTETVQFGSGLIFDDVTMLWRLTTAASLVQEIQLEDESNRTRFRYHYIIDYEFVKPDGEIVKVTGLSDAELFFGLKGIVTRFTLNALPQPAVWKYTDFINSVNTTSVAGICGVFHTVPLLKHSPKVMAAIQNETRFWGQALSKKGGFVGYTVEPLLPTILSHNTTPTAYPPTRDQVYFPFTISFLGWQNAKYDSYFYDAIRQSAECIRHVAIQDGQDISDARFIQMTQYSSERHVWCEFGQVALVEAQGRPAQCHGIDRRIQVLI